MKAALHRKQNLHIEALHNRSERRGEKTYKYVKKTHERQYRIGIGRARGVGGWGGEVRLNGVTVIAATIIYKSNWRYRAFTL